MDHHYYSVPYQLVKEQVDVRLTANTIEVFHKGRRVASHLRSYRAGKATTTHEHRPKSHQRHLEWTPSRTIRWAAKNGPNTGELVTRILKSKPHPEQGFRSCLGLMRLGKRYTPERLEAACTRALAIKAYSYKSVASILKSGLDGQPFPYSRDPTAKTINHQNIRAKTTTDEKGVTILNQQTIEKLYAMRLDGMAEVFTEQLEQPDLGNLSFEERLGMLVDRQWTWREKREE